MPSILSRSAVAFTLRAIALCTFMRSRRHPPSCSRRFQRSSLPRGPLRGRSRRSLCTCVDLAPESSPTCAHRHLSEQNDARHYRSQLSCTSAVFVTINASSSATAAALLILRVLCTEQVFPTGRRLGYSYGIAAYLAPPAAIMDQVASAGGCGSIPRCLSRPGSQ